MEFNFAENQLVPTERAESIPKDFRGLYEETDEGFKLRTDDSTVGSAVSAITGLNRALVAARGEARDAKKNKIDLSPLSDFGDTSDLTALREAIDAKIAEAGKGKNEDLTRQVEKARTELTESFNAKITAKEKEAQALKNQLYSNLVESEAVKALAEAGAIDADLVMPMLKQQVGVSTEDGKFIVQVLDPSGDQRFSTVTGQPMSIKELVQEMKGNEKFGPLFKSEQKTGGGTNPANTRTSQNNQRELSSTEKIAAGLGRR